MHTRIRCYTPQKSLLCILILTNRICYWFRVSKEYKYSYIHFTNQWTLMDCYTCQQYYAVTRLQPALVVGVCCRHVAYLWGRTLYSIRKPNTHSCCREGGVGNLSYLWSRTLYSIRKPNTRSCCWEGAGNLLSYLCSVPLLLGQQKMHYITEAIRAIRKS